MKYKFHKIENICSMIKGIYPTLKTEPGQYPLVVTAKYRRSASTYQLEGPAICVPLISSTGHGDAALHRVHYQEGKFALANLLVALLPKDPDTCEAKYLYHLLMVKKNEYFVPLMLGTANVSLKEKDIGNVEIPLPPLDEQRRIVARIEELAAKVEEARGLRSQANQQLKAFVSSVHLHLGESRTVKLSEILELDERSEIVQIGQQYPQVGVKGFGGGLFAKEVVEATQTTYKAFNRLYEGAIVLSQVKGWEGAIAGCNASLVGRYVSPEYRTFCCIEGQAIPGYISALVITPWFWNQLKNLSRGLGGRRERIHPEQFLQMEVPMPNIDLQKQALESFSKLSVLEHLQTETAAELNALLPSILDKAFKGEL